MLLSAAFLDIRTIVLYNESMQTDFALIPFEGALTNQTYLVVGQHAMSEKMLQLIALLGLKVHFTILDCGNRSNMYTVAKLIRSYTHDPVAVLGHMHLSRAFTCIQVLAMLESVSANPPREPLIILDLLATFLDEDIKLPDAQKLLTRSIVCLSHLSQYAPVIISGRPIPAIAISRQILMEQLQKSVDFYWEEPLPLSAAHGLQPALFA